MRPLTPIASAPISAALSRIASLGTITPRSVTSNPLQLSTIAVIFFPMSWTSPLTVAMTNLGFEPAPLPEFSPIYGASTSIASLIIFADFTTCGRNIRPAPKLSPTVCIPSIRGPSITATALPSISRHSRTSSRRVAALPFTRASESLAGAGSLSAAAETAALSSLLADVTSCALAISLSVASARLSRMTSSTFSSISGSISL